MGKGDKDGGHHTPFAEVARRLKAELREAEGTGSDRSGSGPGRGGSGRRSARSDGSGRAGEAPPARRTGKARRGAPDGDGPGDTDDAALFLAAVGEVAPVHRGTPTRKAREKRPAARLDTDEDAEVLAVLSDLVAGDGTLDVADTDEYVEGLAHGVDRRLLGRLRRGEFSVQAHLDLHGMLQETARHAVRRFLVESRTRGLRCVLVIHGRGKNSKDKEPVLKKALVRWLSRGGLGKQILAFATARPADGGAGAVYVLLRR